jgi:Aspartyl/Asparaginyl beta-hydroxylase
MDALPDRLRLPFAFDPDLLARDLHALATVGWIEHFVPQHYDGDWSVIPLRGRAGATHPVMMISSNPGVTEFEDTPMLDGCPYFRKILDSFACPLRAVRLMRLTPGSVIKEHCDVQLSAEDGTARIHIPVVTNPDVAFCLNGARVVLDAGSAWYLRLTDPHSVYNRGSSDRVHMVVDATVNGWLQDLLESAVLESAARQPHDA